jgi:methionyl-tRNA synthetase
MAKDSKFYVTTPIYYVTAAPHVGSLYSTVIADVVARWHKLCGKKVFFLTGTDEHGQKVAQAAAQAGEEPQKFVDRLSGEYKKIWRMYDLEYSDFIRTTDERHKKAVYEWLSLAMNKGDIYKSRYEGWYCVPDESFVADKDIVQGDKAPLCPTCGRETIPLSEENYFFKLSAYQDKLLQFYKDNPDFVTPKERLNEVISFVQSGLKDLSISRTTVKWAIPFPGDSEHCVYVWVDALVNYISAIGFGDKNKQSEFDFWWPADVHIMGKEIVKFHAVYWPAFLMSAGLPLPKKLLAHGWITVEGKKMSKSLGNVVDPTMLAEKYGIEPVKYYLLRQLPINQDGDFSYLGLEHHINADLVGGLGNLLNRMVALAEKNNVQKINVPQEWSAEAQMLFDEYNATMKEYKQHFEDYSFHVALARLFKLVNQTNAYFHGQEPWKIAKSNPVLFNQIISATCHSLRGIALLLWPIMPHKMETLLKSIGVQFNLMKGPWSGVDVSAWNTEFNLTKVDTLFAKIEPQKPQETKSVEQQEEQVHDNNIDIETFAQVELVVGTVEQAENVEKSSKLIKLYVDFGQLGKRTVFSGIRKWYLPTDLIGKQAVFVYNLKPRAIMGQMSQGMMLAGEDSNGVPQIMVPATPVPNGTRLK